MKVRTQLMLLLLSVIVSLTALSLSLKYKIKKQTRSFLEQNLVETREKDVPKMLEQNSAKISSYIYYYSGWEKLVNFIATKKDVSWAKDVLNNELSIPEIDYVWVVNSEGEPYYSSCSIEGMPVVGLSVNPAELKAGLEKEKFKSFFVRHNNSLVEVFSGHLTKAGDAKPSGYLLLG